MMKQAKEEGEAGAVSQCLDSCLVSLRPWGQSPERGPWFPSPKHIPKEQFMNAEKVHLIYSQDQTGIMRFKRRKLY